MSSPTSTPTISTTPVKLAVVGSGVIGNRHIGAIQNSHGAELVALVDVDPNVATIAGEAGVPFYSDVTTACASRDIDGIVVSTPTIHHLKPSIEAMDAGCHVFVEKPVTASLEEARQLIDHSRATGKHVLVGHQRRYYALIEKARTLIGSGELGRLVAVSGQWCMRKNDDYYNPDWRKQQAAGPVLTNLIHEIDYLRYICGDIESVTAEVSNDVQGFEKEDVAAVVLRFANGALGSFILSDQATSPWSWELATGENPAFPPTGQNAIRFMGSKASLDFPNLTLWHHDGAEANWNSPMTRQQFEQPFEDAYLLQCEHFVRVIRGEESPRIDATDAEKTLRATLAVFEAAEKGQRVDIA